MHDDVDGVALVMTVLEEVVEPTTNLPAICLIGVLVNLRSEAAVGLVNTLLVHLRAYTHQNLQLKILLIHPARCYKTSDV